MFGSSPLRSGLALLTLAATAIDQVDAQCGLPAQHLDLGSGSPGPDLWTPTGVPIAGQPFQVAIQQAPPGAFGVLYLTLSAAQVPTPYGTVWVSTALAAPPITFFADATGRATMVNLTPSSTAGLCGLEFFAQAYVADRGIALGASITDAIQLRMGELPTLDFVPEVQIAVEESPRGIDAGDLNADGRIDMVVANTSSDTVSVLLGSDLGFSAAGAYPTGACPGEAELADLNGDGFLDVVTPNSGADNLTVLLGDGFGGFSPGLSSPTTLGPRGLDLGDLNGDGAVDAVVCNFSDDTLSIFLGAGDGTFVAGQVIPINDGPFHQVLADLNADGFLDSVIAARNTDDVQICLGNGDGTLQAPLLFPVGDRPRNVAVGDVNGDGVLDVACANWFDDSVSTLLGVGDGSLLPGIELGMLERPTYLSLADANGDGLPDLWVSTNASDVSLALGNGDGTFDVPFGVGLSDSPGAIVVGDFDLDGIPDVAGAVGPSNSGGCPGPIGTNGGIALRINALGEL